MYSPIAFHSTDTPLNQETQFTPTDKEALNRDYLFANRLFSPMLAMLDFLQSRYQAYRYRNADLVYATLRLLLRTLEAHENWRCVGFSPVRFVAVADERLPLVDTRSRANCGSPCSPSASL